MYLNLILLKLYIIKTKKSIETKNLIIRTKIIKALLGSDLVSYRSLLKIFNYCRRKKFFDTTVFDKFPPRYRSIMRQQLTDKIKKKRMKENERTDRKIPAGR